MQAAALFIVCGTGEDRQALLLAISVSHIDFECSSSTHAWTRDPHFCEWWGSHWENPPAIRCLSATLWNQNVKNSTLWCEINNSL